MSLASAIIVHNHHFIISEVSMQPNTSTWHISWALRIAVPIIHISTSNSHLGVTYRRPQRVHHFHFLSSYPLGVTYRRPQGLIISIYVSFPTWALRTAVPKGFLISKHIWALRVAVPRGFSYCLKRTNTNTKTKTNKGASTSTSTSANTSIRASTSTSINKFNQPKIIQHTQIRTKCHHRHHQHLYKRVNIQPKSNYYNQGNTFKEHKTKCRFTPISSSSINY